MSTKSLWLNANSQSSTAEIDHRPSRSSARRFLPLKSIGNSTQSSSFSAEYFDAPSGRVSRISGFFERPEEQRQGHRYYHCYRHQEPDQRAYWMRFKRGKYLA